MVSVCTVCGVSARRKALKKCPICFREFCETCGVSRSGRRFCGAFCADYFFHEDEDAEED